MQRKSLDVVGNAKKNIAFGAINRIIVLVLPFMERTVIQTILGAQYLGLDSLFSSIIRVLSLTELGFSSAMVYNMYKPAADGDIQKMNALLNFYKIVYRTIGVCLLGIGLLLIPFLPRLIKGSYPSDINLISLYIIYLINTALSYFLYAYLTSVLVVNQREDVRSIVNSGVRIGLTISQILALFVTRNYYFFAILMVVFTFINNLWLAWRVKTIFPQYQPRGTISDKDKNDIKKLVAGTFVQQACAVTRNSLDSVCISAFLGLTLTAIYNNYYMILTGITTFVGVFTASFIGGVGNHVATKSVKENFEEMKNLDFVYIWISGWCAICLLCMYQPFMKIWMGSIMLLPITSVALFCGYFYLLKLGDIRSMYNSANGLWWEQRYRAIGETIMNLILNITLGRLFGVNGIIFATMLSLFICNYIWSTGITFRLYFTIRRRKDYYIYQVKQSAVIGIVALCTYIICSQVTMESMILELAVRGLICAVLPNAAFFLIYRNNEMFRYAKMVVMKKDS